MCLAYERTQPGTLRHFLKWFITGESEIKRDMDASQGIRIMTIHGSKGLASPIVFLIDTLLVQKKESLLNLNDEHTNPNYDLWIWDTSSSKTAPEIITELHQKDKRKHIAEYYRLLYVAMTRACNQLYIYGCTNNKASQDSWHYKLWDVLSNISDAKIDETTIRIDNDTKIE
jgi:ATP-dependent helicase/nuclease subunit A